MISFIYLISIISPHYEATKAKRSFKLLFLLIQQMVSNRIVISVDPDMRGKFCLLSFCLLLVIQSFFEGQSASWDVAKKEQNRTKNRYGNIIACKKRVVQRRKKGIQFLLNLCQLGSSETLRKQDFVGLVWSDLIDSEIPS